MEIQTRFREGLDTCVVAVVVAVLAWLPEWRTPGFYFHDDMQIQYVPAMIEIGRAARDGHWAILSEYSWFGGALAGEYQHGVFSVFHVLLCAGVAGLSLRSIASIVSLTYYALAGAGAYRAARVLDFRRPLAIAIALVAALNGFNVMWGSWLPAITGWAWLMWLWWALERLRRAERPRFGDVTLAAFASYSVLTAGWHFADLLIAPLVLVVALRCRRPWSARSLFWRMGLGPLLGICLALPALLCFLEYARAGTRTDFDGVSWAWTVPWRALVGLLVPLSTTRWLAFGESTLQNNVVLAGGVLPVVIVLVALVAGDAPRRSYVGLLLAAGFALAWAMLPSLGRVRWPFRWLPVVHLLIALGAAKVLSVESSVGGTKPKFRGLHARVSRELLVALVGAGLIGLVFVFATIDANAIAGAAVTLFTLAAFPLAAARGFDIAVVFCGGVALNLVGAPLVLPLRTGTPTWPSDDCAARWARVDREARYFGIFYIWDIIDPVDQSIGRCACALPGNSSMVERVTFVNGYSTLYTAGLHRKLGLEVHGNLNARGLVDVTGPLASKGGLLERWGIDGLVVPADPYWRSLESRLSLAGLRPAEDLGSARIWRRDAARRRPLLESLDAVDVEMPPKPRANDRPLARRGGWSFDTALDSHDRTDTSMTLAVLTIADVDVAPTRVEATIDAPSLSSRPGLILLRRPWLPGYRATLDGTPVTLGRLDGTLIGAIIPLGKSGRLKIEYVPLGLRIPSMFAVLFALLTLGFGNFYELAMRRRSVGQR